MKIRQTDAVKLVQFLYNDLPDPIQEELSRDTDFMAKIGFRLGSFC